MQLFFAVMKTTFLIKNRSDALRALSLAAGLSLCSMLLGTAWAQPADGLSTPRISTPSQPIAPAGESFGPTASSTQAEAPALSNAALADAAIPATAPSFSRETRVAQDSKRKNRRGSKRSSYGAPEMADIGPGIGMPTELLADAEGASFQQGKASWYGDQFHNRLTANGERYNMNAMTAAHKTLPFGTMVLVKSPDTGKSVMVRINDRGPYVHGRIIDLSRAAATKLGVKNHGVYRVMLYKARKDGKLQRIAQGQES